MTIQTKVFNRKPGHDFTYIRDWIHVAHWSPGIGVLNLDLYSYSNPKARVRFDPYEWEERELHVTFNDRASFKKAYQMARTLIRKQ